MQNDLGQIILDVATPSTGPIAPINGGQVFHNPITYMSTDHNIRVKADNTTTQHELTNVTSASTGSKPRVIDKSTYRVHPNNRENINPTNETQIGLKGATLYQPTNYTDGIRNTMKQTTLYTHNGIATTNVPQDMLQTNYTTKDSSGGVTSIAANKNLVQNYLSGGLRFTGNMTHGGPGEVNFKELDFDKIRTCGNGSYLRAAPELSRLNHVFKEQIGEVNVTPNRLQQEDTSRTDPALISGLLNNGFSIYNNGTNLNFPSFMCDSRPSDYTPYKRTFLPKESIPDRKITKSFPVYNSKKNSNEIIVRNVTSGNTENPMLFSNKEIKGNTSINGLCYSGNILDSGYATDNFTKETSRYVNPPAYYGLNTAITY